MEKITCPLAFQAKNNPNQTAVFFSGRSIAYAHLNQSVWSTVKNLKKLGITPNKRVGIYANNAVEYIITLLAIWRLGAVACLFSTRLPPNGLKNLLEEIRPDKLLISQIFTPDFKKSLSAWFTIEEMINFDIRDFPLAELPEMDLNQDATILQTSGTSRATKSVLHTYGNYYFSAKGANENIPVAPDDRWLLSLPLYHVGGLGILFRILIAGGAVVIPQQGELLSESIKRNKITHLSVVPTQLYRLLQNQNPSDLSSLKCILIGGGPVPKNLLEKGIKKNLPLYVSYGLTEMTSQVATSRKKITDPQFSSTKILSDRQVKISSDGEILVKGKTLFKGYLQRQKINLPVDSDGWFATRDLGLIDKEQNLTVLGRKDNMFISGGENIQPEEIEKKIYELDSIEETIVVERMDSEFGFRPVAFIKSNEERNINSAQIISHLKDTLPKFKIPQEFYQWPGNPLGGLKQNRMYFRDLVQKDAESLKKLS